jgi:hypothetical protein
MKPRFRDSLPAYRIFSIQIVLLVFGAVAAWWGIVEMPIFAHESSVERIARRIIGGEAFKTDVLNGQLLRVRSSEESVNCRPSTMHSAAIIRLRIAESEIVSGNKSQSNEALNSLHSSILKSLSCSPADPFLWLVYSWIQGAHYGRASEQLEDLRMSYQLGPNEGWIGWRRSPIAFAIFERLPPDLAEDAINEFVGLLDMGQYERAAEIFTGPAWHVRNVILERLKSLSERRLEPFVNAVHRRDHEVDLPGINKPARRPWQ